MALTSAGVQAAILEIGDLATLKALQGNGWNGDGYDGYKLTADITMDATNWDPIGEDQITPFTGTFDGQGYTIDNLYINRSEHYLGLFGRTNGATIQNVGMVNVDITGGDTYSNIGGLVGCSVTSIITNYNVV